MNLRNIKKIIPLGTLLLLFPMKANAIWGVPTVTEFISGAFRALGAIFQVIVGAFLWFAGLLVDFALTMNMERLVNSELVQIGWGVARDVANLGFVLVIIVIAFATIFRYRDYAAKKALSNLIIAAILVNFSLAIAGGIINFSDILTKFFLKDKIGIGNTYELSETIAGAFDVQRLNIEDDNLNNRFPPDPETEAGALNTVVSATFIALAGLSFTILFTLFVALGFLALAILLIIRYVVLSILLIIAPVAWLFFAIPGQKKFQEWWDKFIKWAFFAPAVSFFIYIIVLTADGLREVPMTLNAGGFAFLQNILVQGAQMSVMLGLLVGGLMISLKGSGSAADVFQQGVDKVKGGAQKWASRQGKRFGSAPFRKKFGEDNKSLADRTLDATQSDNGLKRFAGKVFSKPMTKIAAGGGERVIKDVESDLRNKSTDEVRAALNSYGSSTPTKIAAISKLVKDGKITKENAAKYLTKDMKDKFEGFGKGGDFKKLEKASGMSLNMRIAMEEGDSNALRNATNEYIKGFKKSDMKDLPWDTIFEKLDKGEGGMGLTPTELDTLASNLIKALIHENPSLTPNILPNMNSQALNKFKRDFERVLSNEIKNTNQTKDPDLFARLEKQEENFEKIIGNYSVGFYADTSGSSSSSSGDKKSSEESSK